LQAIVVQLPSTLQESGQSILKALTEGGNFSWNDNNEISDKGVLHIGSDITKLLSAFVHGSIKFYYLNSSQVFLAALRRQGISFLEPFTKTENIHSYAKSKKGQQR